MSGPLVFTREMGITHRDFLRTLTSAVEGRTYTVDDGAGAKAGVAQIADGRNCIEIRLAPERVRRIATIRMPVTDVEFHFHGHSRAEADAVMARFEIYYRRGGG